MYIIEEEKRKTSLETVTRASKHLAYVLIPCNGMESKAVTISRLLLEK